jgi:hypothetical protein
MISWLPAAHIAERGAHYYLPVTKGVEVSICPDPRTIIDFLPTVRPTWFFAVPRVWEKLKGGLEAMMANLPDEQRIRYHVVSPERTAVERRTILALRREQRIVDDDVAADPHDARLPKSVDERPPALGDHGRIATAEIAVASIHQEIETLRADYSCKRLNLGGVVGELVIVIVIRDSDAVLLRNVCRFDQFCGFSLHFHMAERAVRRESILELLHELEHVALRRVGENGIRHDVIKRLRQRRQVELLATERIEEEAVAVVKDPVRQRKLRLAFFDRVSHHVETPVTLVIDRRTRIAQDVSYVSAEVEDVLAVPVSLTQLLREIGELPGFRRKKGHRSPAYSAA